MLTEQIVVVNPDRHLAALAVRERVRKLSRAAAHCPVAPEPYYRRAEKPKMARLRIDNDGIERFTAVQAQIYWTRLLVHLVSNP